MIADIAKDNQERRASLFVNWATERNNNSLTNLTNGINCSMIKRTNIRGARRGYNDIIKETNEQGLDVFLKLKVRCILTALVYIFTIHSF